MAGDSPGPGKTPMWRRRKDGGARRDRPKGRARTGWAWMQRKDRTPEREEFRRRLRIYAGILIAVLLVGFFLWKIFIRYPTTPIYIVTVTEYAAPIPPNAWAREDCQRLEQLNKQPRVATCFPIEWPGEANGREALKRELDKFQETERGISKDRLIVYLSMHGVVNENNEPCLLSPDSVPTDSSTWLRVEDLLDELFGSKSSGQVPDRVGKLVVFDSNRMEANWNLGLLRNDFAGRLKELAEKKCAEIPNLVVLNSTGEGQIGHYAPELGASVFGYYLFQGLKGAADNEVDGDRDEAVDVDELAEYLRKYVGQWVDQNRHDRQQPMVVRDPKSPPNFDVILAKEGSETTHPGSPRTGGGDRWKAVYDRWAEHERLSRKEPPPYRFNPLKWAEYQQTLVRLEQLLLAGSAYEVQFDDTVGKANSLFKYLNEVGPPEVTAYSVKLARQFRDSPREFDDAIKDDEERLRAYLMRPVEEAEPKAEGEAPEGASEAKAEPDGPSEKPKAENEGADETEKPEAGAEADSGAKEEAEEIQPPQSYLTAAGAAWRWFLDEPFPDRADEVFAFVGQANRPLETDVIELHFSRMLRRHVDWQSPQSPATSVKQALSARDQAEEASAPRDVRAHYWVQSLVHQADLNRRKAEDKLFVGGASELTSADDLWEQAVDDYRKAINLADELAEAYRVRDQAWAELPYLAQWVFAGRNALSAEDKDDIKALGALIESTRELTRVLDVPATDGAENRQKLTRDVKANRELLFDRLDSKWRIDWDVEDAQTLADITRLVTVPLVPDDGRRESILGKLRECYFRREIKYPSAEGGDEPPSQESDEPPAQKSVDRIDQCIDRLREQHPALGGQHPALAILRASKAEGGRVEPDLAWQGAEVRKLLEHLDDTKSKLRQQDSDAKDAVAVRAGANEAARRVRASAALLDASLHPTSWFKADKARAAKDPVYQLYRLDLHNLLLWHAHRTMDDFWEAPNVGQTPYFETVAQAYLTSARGLLPLDEKLDDKLVHGGLNLEAELAKLAEASRNWLPWKDAAAELTLDKDASNVRYEPEVEFADGQPSGQAALWLNAGRDVVETGRAEDSPRQRRLAIEVQREQKPENRSCFLETDDIAGKNRLSANVFYRGRLRQREIGLKWPAPIVIRHPRDEPERTTVTVLGDVSQTVSVMFVLDCSGSMNKSFTVAGDVRATKTSRYPEALNALDTILDELIKLDGSVYHVGILVYGHRVGWEWSDEIHDYQQVMWDPAVPRLQGSEGQKVPKPDQSRLPHPNRDIERIWPLSPLSPRTRAEIMAKLRQQGPLGETPLYLAIIEAAGVLQKTEQGLAHIIAVTDGVDERSEDEGDKVLPLHVRETLNRLGKDRVRLDIAGICTTDEHIDEYVKSLRAGNVPLSPADQKAERDIRIRKRNDLLKLATDYAGKFHPANNPDELLEALKESLRLMRYEVARRQDGEVVATESLGRPVEIVQPFHARTEYVVRLTDEKAPVETQVELAGNEALVLTLTRTGRAGRTWLAHKLYHLGLRQGEAMFDPNVFDRATGDRFFVGAHLPEYEGNDPKFLVSIQNAEDLPSTEEEFWAQYGQTGETAWTEFSHRPREVWCKITPDFEDPSAPVYTFYDLNFVPHKPVPLLSFTARNWPRDDDKASIRIWFNMNKTESDRTFQVSELESEQPEVTLGGRTVKFKARLEEKSDDQHVVLLVTEDHTAGGPLPAGKVDLPALRVELEPPDRLSQPLPVQTIHEYRPELGKADHKFYFEAKDVDRGGLGGYFVKITEGKKIVDRAVSPKRPLEVPVR